LSPGLATFAVSLLATVVLLALAVATGLRAQRRRHICSPRSPRWS
jgi:hypothetical protein